MKGFKTNIVVRIFAFALSLHILNISADPIDPTPYLSTRNSVIDEMESITEIIFNKVFHIKNLFVENKHDNNNKGTLLAHHVNQVLYYHTYSILSPLADSHRFLFPHADSFIEQHLNDTLTPPPKS